MHFRTVWRESTLFLLQIMRDVESGNSKGYAFINFANFDGSDTALEAMNGQYLCNRPITVSYAFKKDAKGERHGSAAERLLAAQNPLSQSDKPHTLFVYLDCFVSKQEKRVHWSLLGLLISHNSLQHLPWPRQSMHFPWHHGYLTGRHLVAYPCHPACRVFHLHHLHSQWYVLVDCLVHTNSLFLSPNRFLVRRWPQRLPAEHLL